MATGVILSGGPGPAHRLGTQLVERRRDVLAVRARPQLQRQPGIDIVVRPHAPIQPRPLIRVFAAAGSDSEPRDRAERDAGGSESGAAGSDQEEMRALRSLAGSAAVTRASPTRIAS